jgi:hypothetical protein
MGLMKTYRHGDLGITPTKEIPKGLKKIYSGKEFILAYGEATGHHHKLVADKVEIFMDNSGKMYFKTDGGELTHQEHKTIKIDKGCYFVNRENEFDYFLEEIKQTKD